MDYLTDNQITSTIIDYINENIYNYAIMLDGSWGSGKTYYVKKKLIPEIEKLHVQNGRFKKVVYVSLYGLKNIDDISDLIFMKFVEFKVGKKIKFLPIINTGIKVFAEKFDISSLSEMNLKTVFEDLVDWNEYVFIFDDLERCSISVNNVLGFINNLVEHNDIKVIIIANQEEIGKLNVQDNIELKYFLATQNSIDFNANRNATDRKSLYGTGKNNDTKLDLSTLKDRVNYLFEENYIYNQIKEKLIGRTIYYRPQLSEVIYSIINHYFSEDFFHNVAEPIMKQLQNIMISKEHYNIRTFQFVLLFLKKVYILMEKESYKSSDNYNEIFQDIFIAALNVAISFKKGEKNYKWEDKSEYGYIYLEEIRLDGYFRSFKFIHDYIYFSNFDELKIKRVLVYYEKELINKKDAIEDPSNILTYYWELEDEYIESKLIELGENFKADKYSTESYKWILSLVIKLKDIGINILNIDEIFDIMMENIRQGKGTVESYQEPIIKSNDPLLEELKSYMNKLYACEQEYKKGRQGTDINTIFNNDKVGWSAGFYQYYLDNKSEFFANKGFFKFIDIDSCINQLNISSVKDFSDFRRSIYSIYDFSNIKDFYIDDCQNIMKLKDKLNKISYPQKIKDYNRKLLINSLSSILNRLQDKD